MPEQKYPTSVSLSPEIRRKLKAYSEPRGWSVSKIIEYIVRSWLAAQEERDRQK